MIEQFQKGAEPMSSINNMTGYKVGDKDSRGWGGYIVTAVGTHGNGEEFCEKDITVNPGQALSLQSHDHRREHWVVTEGTLTVVLDGDRLTLEPGDDVRIPVGGVHCMANLSSAKCVVHEVQEGLCREEDIHRFKDMNNRPVEQSDASNVVSSLTVYDQILGEIGFTSPDKYPAPAPHKV
jgi:mannose-6-phosphate isomerase